MIVLNNLTQLFNTLLAGDRCIAVNPACPTGRKAQEWRAKLRFDGTSKAPKTARQRTEMSAEANTHAHPLRAKPIPEQRMLPTPQDRPKSNCSEHRRMTNGSP